MAPIGSKAGEISLVVIDLDFLADEKVLTPADQRDIVVVHHGDEVRFISWANEEAEIAPLDAVPADSIG